MIKKLKWTLIPTLLCMNLLTTMKIKNKFMYEEKNDKKINISER